MGPLGLRAVCARRASFVGNAVPVYQGRHHHTIVIVSGCEVGAVFSEVDCVESAQSSGQLKAQEKPSERAAAVHRLDHRSGRVLSRAERTTSPNDYHEDLGLTWAAWWRCSRWQEHSASSLHKSLTFWNSTLKFGCSPR